MELFEPSSYLHFNLLRLNIIIINNGETALFVLSKLTLTYLLVGTMSYLSRNDETKVKEMKAMLSICDVTTNYGTFLTVLLSSNCK